MDNVIIEPMRGDLILWRCLHGGPLSAENLDRPALHPEIDWPSTRARNVPLLKKLVETYGTCAFVARDGGQVVGTLRFYPKAICPSGEGGAAFCLQQAYPAGPKEDRAAGLFPSLDELTDKALFVHCLMVVSPEGDPGRYRRKGLATRLARGLIDWAGERGWEAIEACAYEEIPMLYAIAGVAGKRFWEKVGFRCVHADSEPGMTGDLLEAIRRDAVAAGIPAGRATNRYRMRVKLARS